jgi:hypothetical protein
MPVAAVARDQGDINALGDREITNEVDEYQQRSIDDIAVFIELAVFAEFREIDFRRHLSPKFAHAIVKLLPPQPLQCNLQGLGDTGSGVVLGVCKQLSWKDSRDFPRVFHSAKHHTTPMAISERTVS